MRRLHIVMPMGGLGSRFAKDGFGVPKPLIPVEGQPMFMKALSSFAGYEGPQAVTAIIRQELDRDFALGSEIRKSSGANVVVIPELTRGSVETCLAAAANILPDDGVVVLDCDLWFHSPAYLAVITDILNGKHALDGVLLTFASDKPRYSFAVLEGKRVLRTAEKEPISTHALAGAYFFGTGGAFLKAARSLMEKAPVGEYYTSDLYNIIIAQGGVVEAAPVEEYASFGTPEELALYTKGNADR